MLELINHTPFACSLGVFADQRGVECAYGVVKATFTMHDSQVQLAAKPLPIVPVDQYAGDPLASSLKSVSEMTLTKPHTDVLLMGHAWPAHGPTSSMEIALTLGGIQKKIRVFGDRAWKSGLTGYKPSEPEPFEKMPLVYERAFGGTDSKPRDPNKVEYHPANPVGKGFLAGSSQLKPEEVPLPNLEDPATPIRSPKDRPPTACWAPVCPHWEPRKSFAGTYDAAWTKKRAPYLPADFNPRFFQAAPPGLTAEGYLQGGETVELVGVAPQGPLQFSLPVCSLDLVFHLDGRQHRHVPNLDTVLFEPDQGRFSLVWRACQVVDKKLLRLRALELSCRQYPKREAA